MGLFMDILFGLIWCIGLKLAFGPRKLTSENVLQHFTFFSVAVRGTSVSASNLKRLCTHMRTHWHNYHLLYYMELL